MPSKADELCLNPAPLCKDCVPVSERETASVNVCVCEKQREHCISMHQGPDYAGSRQHTPGFDGL